MTDLGTRTLTTERLVLRRFTPDDAPAVYANWASDPAVTVTLEWEAHPDLDVTRAVLQTWAEQHESDGYYNWAITRDGEAIGAIAVVNCSAQHAYAEIGYALSRSLWRQGIMTEALGAVTDFLFGEVGVNRLLLMHDTQNPASGRVMVKNGYMLEGVLREQRRRKDGSFGDLRVYGMLQKEWRVRQTAARLEEERQ